MQIKTIQKVLTLKMNEWLNSIQNESLRKKVESNLLVSGGSIVSMLLNEPVNDYDVYINDMDVLKDLAAYYTKDKPIEIFDGRQREKLLEETERKGIYYTSLNTLKPDQIKLFFEDKNGGFLVDYPVSQEVLPAYRPLFFSANAISLSDDVQIVLRFHGNNEEIHKTFDFIHATCYFTFDEGLVTNVAALESIITKQLRYQGSLYPLTSIIRMKKFIKRGWGISAGEILKIMFQISELNLKDPDVLEEQLIGVDVAYFSKLIEILRGVEVEKMTSQYLNTIIDKVFNGSEIED